MPIKKPDNQNNLLEMPSKLLLKQLHVQKIS